MAVEQFFTIGAVVSCRDGECGSLRRIVFHPARHELTHLVVSPSHRRRDARLVPVALVDGNSETIALRCTRKEFDRLAAADESQFLLVPGGALGYGPDQAMALPYFGAGLGAMDGGQDRFGRDLGASTSREPAAISYDRVPDGEAEIQRGDRVIAADGPIGKVRGLVIHPGDHRVTHLLLEEGHLFGAREVAIPISSIATGGGEVRLKLTKAEVDGLPSA